MNADGTIKSSFYIYNGATAWLVRCAGDIDGDGVADLIWQLPTGKMVCWLMNADGTLKSSFYVHSGTASIIIRGSGS
jgi:hypothetical protein